MHSELKEAFPGMDEARAGAQAGPLLFRNLGVERAISAESEAPRAGIAAPSMDLPAAMEAAREEGRREAVASLQRDMESRVQSERAQVSSALDAFMAEKKKYFSGLEREVVRLALAIAERVLHRESAMDPTLLAGAARVLLEQVDQESAATLLVGQGDAAQWKAAMLTLDREVAIREDASLQRGECLLQTDSGSFELGLKSQLCEIERGFFELLGRSAAVAA